MSRAAPAGPADSGDDSADGDRTRRVMKSYNVFNVAQIDNLPDRFAPPTPLVVEPGSAQDEAHRAEIDAFIADTRAVIVHGGNEACYYPSRDLIHLPHATAFDTYAHYGATAAHELAHWTGHPTRLNRDLANRFGSDAYAAEELVAELASALIGADLGLPVTHLDNHASYIDHWLRILRADERALMTAAARAEEAAAFPALPRQARADHRRGRRRPRRGPRAFRPRRLIGSNIMAEDTIRSADDLIGFLEADAVCLTGVRLADVNLVTGVLRILMTDGRQFKVTAIEVIDDD